MAQLSKLVDWEINRAPLMTDDIVAANIQLLKQLAGLHPDVCVRLALDATDVAAWVQQLPKQSTPEQERRIRRRARNASYHVIERNGRVVDRWRGYYLYILVDLATNRPVTWYLAPEGATPKRALRFLLNACTRSGATIAQWSSSSLTGPGTMSRRSACARSTTAST